MFGAGLPGFDYFPISAPVYMRKWCIALASLVNAWLRSSNHINRATPRTLPLLLYNNLLMRLQLRVGHMLKEHINKYRIFSKVLCCSIALFQSLSLLAKNSGSPATDQNICRIVSAIKISD